MRVHQSIENYDHKDQSSVLTIGTFDGVHIGHQKIIARLNEIKNKPSERSMILTFYPHPRRVLDQSNDIKMLTTMEEKTQLLEKFGLDDLIIEPFTKEFSRLSALDFVRNILVHKLHLTRLVIGYDHHFGKNREGNFEQLTEYGELYGFTVEKIPAQEIEHVSVSSTKIRKALESGDIMTANKYLGYNYLLTGNIVKGQGIGRKINFPTVNLDIEEDFKLIPKRGVYVVRALFKDKHVFGIMNIGFRPTVGGNGQTIEIHLLDFQGDLYGSKMQIEVLHRVRDEQKFETIEELALQISKDEKSARIWLMNSK
ncbi:bifunctional riboflavin kinase/FAD synthetase [Lutimonas vermicola]|uniref:Riboflavin biosynthesis protein n=1 Tax=Lutimonas vermicola TaxID=414288 RepID=A0ABU9L139_9FLAO